MYKVGVPDNRASISSIYDHLHQINKTIISKLLGEVLKAFKF
jgi:hypothetical protein